MNFQEQQRELQIQKQIRQAEDDLVTWVEAALENTQSYGDLQESQFRNLVRVADTTESPEVIKNFLRYQVGRDKKWGEGKNSLAETIVADIDNKIKKAAETIHKAIAKEESVNKEIWIELIRRYLGYGARRLKYLNYRKSLKMEK